MYQQSEKKLLNSNISSTSLHYMVNFGSLAADSGWRVWRTLANFNGFHVLPSSLHPTSLNRGQPHFARCFGCLLGWYTIYTFWGLLPPSGILPVGKFTLCPSLAFSYIGSITERHSSSGHQPNCVARYKEWNYGAFTPGNFQKRAPPEFRRWPSWWA